MRQWQWSEKLARCLAKLGKTAADARNDLKSAEWKAAVALRMKEITQAKNLWLTAARNGETGGSERLCGSIAGESVRRTGH